MEALVFAHYKESYSLAADIHHKKSSHVTENISLLAPCTIKGGNKMSKIKESLYTYYRYGNAFNRKYHQDVWAVSQKI